MGLVLNKAKRETVSFCILGLAILGVFINLGFFIYLPISKLIESGKFISFEQLFPFNRKLLTPVPGISISLLLFLISFKLREDGTWISETYEKLSPQTLLLILLFSVWIILPLLGAAIEEILL